MKDTEFNLLDPVAEAINTKFPELLNKGELNEAENLAPFLLLANNKPIN